MKRSQIKRSRKPIKRTALNRVSKKWSKQLKIYSVLRKKYLADHPYCEVFLVCQNKSTQIHHKKRRGKYLNDTSTWLATCDSCHTWIETHANLARQLGLINT